MPYLQCLHLCFTHYIFRLRHHRSYIYSYDVKQKQKKVENESLRKELKEKQDLLVQASKAMEMLENQHKKESNQAQMIIDDLNHKIEAMTVSIYSSVAS